VPVLAWAALLTVLASVLLAWTPDAELQWGPLAAAAGVTWLVGIALLGRARSSAARLPERSYGTLVLALGLAAVFGGAVLGLWFTLVGCGLVLLGLSLVLRERTR
jgi:hypothetical protein